MDYDKNHNTHDRESDEKGEDKEPNPFTPVISHYHHDSADRERESGKTGENKKQ